MKRKLKYLVYVDKEIMDKPLELFDAVMAHLIKKELDTRTRKQFLTQFMKANQISGKRALEVIDEWVQVRDVVTFPYRNTNLKAEADQLSEEHAHGAESATALRRGEIVTEDNDLPEEEQDADTEVEGGVPVEDGADEEPESGVAPE